MNYLKFGQVNVEVQVSLDLGPFDLLKMIRLAKGQQLVDYTYTVIDLTVTNLQRKQPDDTTGAMTAGQYVRCAPSLLVVTHPDDNTPNVVSVAMFDNAAGLPVGFQIDINSGVLTPDPNNDSRYEVTIQLTLGKVYSSKTSAKPLRRSTKRESI